MSAFRATRPAFSALRQIARPAYTTAARQVAARPVSRTTQLQGLRFKTDNFARSAFAKNPIITYDELKPITEQPSDDILLVDVRERDENALGSIPSAVNLPLSELKEALAEEYNPGDFQSVKTTAKPQKYAFQKPLPKQNIIFFCRSGKRSATAGELAGERGYHNVRNYTGSWLDWSKRESSGRNDDDD